MGAVKTRRGPGKAESGRLGCSISATLRTATLHPADPSSLAILTQWTKEVWIMVLTKRNRTSSSVEFETEISPIGAVPTGFRVRTGQWGKQNKQNPISSC